MESEEEFGRARRVLAAADELDDFVTIARLEASLGPCGAREDFEVALDGDAAGVEAERKEQVGDAGAGLCFAGLAIHYDCQSLFHRGHFQTG